MVKCLTSMLLSVIMMLSLAGTTTFAANVDNVAKECSAGENTLANAEPLAYYNEQFEAVGSSTVKELQELYAKYLENARQSTTTAERAKWLNLASTIKTLISDYNNYDQTQAHAYSGLQANRSGDVLDVAYLKAAVAAVVAWFSMKEYYLSAELLITARDNNNVNYVYNVGGMNRTKVLNNDVVANIVSSRRTRGSGEFTTSNADPDLYYAIHYFDYEKKNGILFITDIYDYAHQDLPYVSLQDMAVDTMARAQDAGVIVPYHVVVTRSIGK